MMYCPQSVYCLGVAAVTHTRTRLLSTRPLGVREAVVLALIAAPALECVSRLSGSFHPRPCAGCSQDSSLGNKGGWGGAVEISDYIITD